MGPPVTVIDVQNLSKAYKLYQRPMDLLLEVAVLIDVAWYAEGRRIALQALREAFPCPTAPPQPRR